MCFQLRNPILPKAASQSWRFFGKRLFYNHSDDHDANDDHYDVLVPGINHSLTSPGDIVYEASAALTQIFSR